MNNLYDNTAERYDIRHENATTNYLRKREREIIRRYAKGLVLDIGCGTGIYAPDIENYIGIDISKNMIREAFRKNRKQFIISDAEKLPFKSSCFNSVICMFTVLNLCNYQKCIEEMSRVIKKDGFAVISIASIWDRKNYSFFQKIRNRYSSDSKTVRIESNKLKFRLFKKDEIMVEFMKNGFILAEFHGIYKLQQPYWNKYKNFSFLEKIKLVIERVLPSKIGRIYIAVFRKA